MRTLSQCWYIQFSGLVTQLDAFSGESPMICRRLSLYHIFVLYCYVYSFGRKPTVIMAHLTYFIGGLATIFVQDYNFLLFMRFLVGCAHHTVSHLPFLIGKPQWFIMHASNSISLRKTWTKQQIHMFYYLKAHCHSLALAIFIASNFYYAQLLSTVGSLAAPFPWWWSWSATPSPPWRCLG